ncbi:hypothetical protein E2C01_009236 [Portunus trituberculatus]|uniref:Uncharacterized protein n=1 Tax=Portunus trituberculatus TaxID=210409 RepID=A0A5B7D2Y3_PORTR|nr:hypothetical protein [Portunus trituberculatus]
MFHFTSPSQDSIIHPLPLSHLHPPIHPQLTTYTHSPILHPPPSSSYHPSPTKPSTYTLINLPIHNHKYQLIHCPLTH